ncbi:hypothetical protein IWX76_000144 [Pedobacter sp. CAN_A7]
MAVWFYHDIGHDKFQGNFVAIIELQIVMLI